MRQQAALNEPTIEDGVPVPPPISGVKGKGRRQIVFKKLRVGQSVFFQNEKLRSIQASARRSLGADCYAIRSVDGGVRVWRTK